VFGCESDDASFTRLKTASGLSDESWADFVIYAAAFYANMGNYKSFGDCKIFPALPAGM
jgi:dipeptidyl-peptidase-3